MTTSTTGFTAEQLNSMRDWIADCYSHDPFFDIDDLTDDEVVRVIRRDYEGGIPSFMETEDYWERDR